MFLEFMRENWIGIVDFWVSGIWIVNEYGLFSRDYFMIMYILREKRVWDRILGSINVYGVSGEKLFIEEIEWEIRRKLGEVVV